MAPWWSVCWGGSGPSVRDKLYFGLPLCYELRGLKIPICSCDRATRTTGTAGAPSLSEAEQAALLLPLPAQRSRARAGSASEPGGDCALAASQRRAGALSIGRVTPWLPSTGLNSRAGAAPSRAGGAAGLAAGWWRLLLPFPLAWGCSNKQHGILGTAVRKKTPRALFWSLIQGEWSGTCVAEI